MNLKVLWTIAGSMGTLSDIAMLKKVKSFKIDVITADSEDNDASGLAANNKKYVVPKVKDSKYIEAIINICKHEKITTIIPQYTGELFLMSQNIKRFSSLGTRILVTEDPERLRIANDKIKLYQFLNSRDYIPEYKSASNIDSVKNAVLAFGYPNVSVCVKPGRGEGGKGFRIITKDRVDIFNESIDTPRMSLEAYINQLKAVGNIPELLITEYLPGKEYSVDCVCKNGYTYICIPRQRIKTSMGVSSISLVEKNEDLIAYSKEIISSLNLSYNINLQFKYSNDGKPKLIEINPRVSGSLVANFGAGVNMLEAALRLAYNMPVENIDIKWGTKMIRHWDQVFIQV